MLSMSKIQHNTYGGSMICTQWPNHISMSLNDKTSTKTHVLFKQWCSNNNGGGSMFYALISHSNVLTSLNKKRITQSNKNAGLI